MGLTLASIATGTDAVGVTQVLPARVGIVREFGIIEAPIICDFLAEPCGSFQLMIGAIKLDLRDHKSGVLTFEDVDFPHQVRELDDVARLTDDDTLAPRQQFLCVCDRDRVFILVPLDTCLNRLDSQCCSLGTIDTDAQRNTLVLGQVGLTQMTAAHGMLFPVVRDNTEFALNFECHGDRQFAIRLSRWPCYRLVNAVHTRNLKSLVYAIAVRPRASSSFKFEEVGIEDGTQHQAILHCVRSREATGSP